LQAASAALHVSKRQGITPLVNMNTAFATRTAPLSHWRGASESTHFETVPTQPIATKAFAKTYLLSCAPPTGAEFF